jgi:hypothetical protein
MKVGGTSSGGRLGTSILPAIHVTIPHALQIWGANNQSKQIIFLMYRSSYSPEQKLELKCTFHSRLDEHCMSPRV